MKLPRFGTVGRHSITAAVSIAVSMAAAFEGYVPVARPDPIGVPTYCYGETTNVQPGRVFTKDECKALLKVRIAQFANGIDKCITVEVPDKALASFIDLSYNIGTGAFCKSTLVKKLNAGDLAAACNEIMKWNRAGGRVLRGLTIRRRAEAEQCLEDAT